MSTTESVDWAYVFPTGFQLRQKVCALAGALVAAFGVIEMGPIVGMILGIAVSVGLWFALRTASRSFPLRRSGRIEITGSSFVVLRGHSRDVVAEQPLANFESHHFRPGFATIVPQRLTLVFKDGSRWAMTAINNIGGLASFARTLDVLTDD